MSAFSTFSKEWGNGFACSKIGGICFNQSKQTQIKGYERISPIVNILEKRFPCASKGIAVSLIKKAMINQVPAAYIEEHAKMSDNISSWKDKVNQLITEYSQEGNNIAHTK